MPSVLNLNTQELSSVENRSKYTVSVIGCGQRGLFFANAFAEAGFKVICADADQSLVKRLAKGKCPFLSQEDEKTLKNHVSQGKLKASSDIKDTVKQSNVVVLTVPVKIDEKKNPNRAEVINSCKQIGSALQSGTLVIFGEISSLGFFEGDIKETLENTSGLKLGKDFCLAYVPYPQTPNQSLLPAGNLEFKISAVESVSLNVGSALLSALTAKIKQVTDIKTAELSELVRVAKQDTLIALANELAVFCESAGVDFFEIAKLTETACSDFYTTISDEKNNSEIYMLLESAESLNSKLRLPLLARQINDEMIRHGLVLTQSALRNCGKTLRRAKIAVFGAISQSSTEQFSKMLVQKGAKVTVYDPAVGPELSETMEKMVKKTLNEAVEGVDCIVFLSGQEQFKRLNLKKLRTLMKSPAVLVGLAGLADLQRAETEGFIYQGLGKGLRKT